MKTSGLVLRIEFFIVSAIYGLLTIECGIVSALSGLAFSLADLIGSISVPKNFIILTTDTKDNSLYHIERQKCDIRDLKKRACIVQ